MNNKVKELLNAQVTSELESAYLYLEFSNFFDSNNLSGYAHYYKEQAKEEIKHAMKIYDYLHASNEKIELLVIREPRSDFENIQEVLHEGLEVERRVSRMINAIYREAIDANDYTTKVFITWFINEQKEEETSAQRMIVDYDVFHNSLYDLDNKYGQRKEEIL